MATNANITLDYKGFFREFKSVVARWQEIFQKHLELEILAELRQASRDNFRNRTFRLWRTIRRIPGRGARIGSRHAPYWRNIDNYTRGMGLFARLLLRPPEVRERIIERALQATERELGRSPT